MGLKLLKNGDKVKKIKQKGRSFPVVFGCIAVAIVFVALAFGFFRLGNNPTKQKSAENIADYIDTTDKENISNYSLIETPDPDRLKYVVDDLDKKNCSIVLKYGSKQFNIDVNKYTKTKSVFRHNAINPELPDKELLKLILSQGFSAREATEYVFGGLTRDIEKWLAANVDKKKRDAELKFYPDEDVKFVITKHSNGCLADRNKLYKDLCNALMLEGMPKTVLTVSASEIVASVKADDLVKQTSLRSRFITSVASSSAERKHNVGLALKAFNGKILQPGETISFNGTVGARTAERGYKTAKIILQGKYEEGLGGGVCQSSTTLYNAALLADMSVSAAKNHSLTAGYVEPSFDAMVTINYSDLEFTNIGDYPVYIRTFCNSTQAGVEFYGTKLPYKIKRKSVVTKRTPPPADQVIIDVKGEYSNIAKYTDEQGYHTAPKDAVESKGYLQYYNSKGALIKEILIRKDKYTSQQGVLIKGALPRPAPEPPAVEQDKGFFNN